MADLDNYILDNIFSYLKINKIIFINKKYYNKSKSTLKKSTNLISMFYLHNKIKLEMAYEYLENNNSIKNYLKLCYPKEKRYYFLYLCKINRNYFVFDNNDNNVYKILDNLLFYEYEPIFYNSKKCAKIIKYHDTNINKIFRIIVDNLNINIIISLVENIL